MQKKPKYLSKEFDPLMMEQIDITIEELVAHFTWYAMHYGLDPFRLYNDHVSFQAESAGHIAKLGETEGIEECRQAWAERERRLKMIAEVQSEILEGR